MANLQTLTLLDVTGKVTFYNNILRWNETSISYLFTPCRQPTVASIATGTAQTFHALGRQLLTTADH